MESPFHCELNYVWSDHLNQLYHGFEMLRRKGIVSLSIKRAAVQVATSPLLHVIVNDKYEAIYDTLDGLNWRRGTKTENLKYFKNKTEADFYFKRSLSKEVLENRPNDCHVFPLGLNYAFAPGIRMPKTLKERAIDTAFNNALVAKFYKRKLFDSLDFEHYPTLNKKTKILFLTRLWDPDEVELEQTKEQRIAINTARIKAIRACKKAFGDRFTGGITGEGHPPKEVEDLIVSRKLTRKDRFIELMKEHDICVTTAGLHQSIGWSFAEFVAASRGILTQPLHYLLPGEFQEDKNYLSFQNEDELIQKIRYLIDNREALSDMMLRNYHYYNNYVRSDSLVLNTLLQIQKYR